MQDLSEDELFMKQAIRLAEQAYSEDEVPVGAIVVAAGKIIGKGYNQTEKLHDVTAHAEMIALTAASEKLNGKFLNECTLYVTLEPCLMCAGALQNSRISRIVYGANEPKTGFSTYQSERILNKVEIQGGVLQEECSGLLTQFFKAKR